MFARVLVDPVAWMSAALLFVVERAFGRAAQVIVPRLIELIDVSPRLAMLGFLAFILSPGVVVALVHRVTSRKLDRFEVNGARSTARSSSRWAGTLAWLVLFGSNLLSTRRA